MKKILADLNFEEINALVKSLGAPAYRAKQLYSGIASGLKVSQINIDAELKSRILIDYEDSALEIIQDLKSADGSVKFLYKLCDGNIIEGVLMRYKYGDTLCVSTQVGCRMGCDFCASGLNGLIRNLTSGEILSQVAAANRYCGGNIAERKVTNIVLMGSGEPLDNYDNTVKFLRNVNESGSLNISHRNISLSTCGLADKITLFASEKMQVNLTVSLHSGFDELRAKIMPSAKSNSIEKILKACDFYFKNTKRRYIFEYSLIKGVNDKAADSDRLIQLLKGRPCHINLIRLNRVPEKSFDGTDEKAAYRFLGALEKGGLSASLRRRIGVDIGGACGQLRNTYVKTNLTRS